MNPESKNGEHSQDELSITHHRVTIEGRELRYTVTTGRMILKEEQDQPEKHAGDGKDEQPPETLKPKAAIFFVAYTLDPA